MTSEEQQRISDVVSVATTMPNMGQAAVLAALAQVWNLGFKAGQLSPRQETQR